MNKTQILLITDFNKDMIPFGSVRGTYTLPCLVIGAVSDHIFAVHEPADAAMSWLAILETNERLAVIRKNLPPLW